MSKGLEALERLMADYYEMCQDLGNNDDQYQRCNLTSERAIIEKELKALEIIKNKKVDISGLFVCFDDFKNDNVEGCRRYNEEYVGCLHRINVLTQEEYDLLKEVLVCH